MTGSTATSGGGKGWGRSSMGQDSSFNVSGTDAFVGKSPIYKVRALVVRSRTPPIHTLVDRNRVDVVDVFFFSVSVSPLLSLNVHVAAEQ